jgi:acyl-CoA synthetase (NDP forming)
MSALREAAARKPVAIYKGGRTEAGKRTAHGHTASLTTSVAVFDALCRQVNAIQVGDVEMLTDVLVALRFASPLPRGTGVAVVGTGGGPSVLASDEMEQAGLLLPSLSAEVKAELRGLLPLAGSIFDNPVDATTLLSPHAISATMRVLGGVREIDMLVYHLGFHPVSRWGGGLISSRGLLEGIIQALTDARQEAGKPVLLALRPAPDEAGMKDFCAAQEAFVRAGFPVFHSLRRLGMAMAGVAAWNRA